MHAVDSAHIRKVIKEIAIEYSRYNIPMIGDLILKLRQDILREERFINSSDMCGKKLIRINDDGE